MSETLYILGAGADCALGLPIMSNLFQKLYDFENGPGAMLDRALRKKAPYLQLRLGTYADARPQDIGAMLLGDKSHLLDVVIRALERHRERDSERVGAVLGTLMQMQELKAANILGEPLARSVTKAVGPRIGNWGGTVLQPDTFILSQPIRQIMQLVFTTAGDDIVNITPEERDAIGIIAVNVLGFEDMLGGFFHGFFTGGVASQKKYFYLTWMFWGYLRYCVNQTPTPRPQSFYDTLSEVADASEIITFNYTNFFCDKTRPKLGYFHGDFNSYINFANRDWDRGDHIFNRIQSISDMAAFIESQDIDFTVTPPRVPLPAFLPPISMKPLLCSEYLDIWHWCSERIRVAKTIFVIGYSFAAVDEHFNDLVRKKNPKAQIIMINPFLSSVESNLTRIGYDPTTAIEENINGYRCLRDGRFLLVEAFAEKVSARDLVDFIA